MRIALTALCLVACGDTAPPRGFDAVAERVRGVMATTVAQSPGDSIAALEGSYVVWYTGPMASLFVPFHIDIGGMPVGASEGELETSNTPTTSLPKRTNDGDEPLDDAQFLVLVRPEDAGSRTSRWQSRVVVRSGPFRSATPWQDRSTDWWYLDLQVWVVDLNTGMVVSSATFPAHSSEMVSKRWADNQMVSAPIGSLYQALDETGWKTPPDPAQELETLLFGDSATSR